LQKVFEMIEPVLPESGIEVHPVGERGEGMGTGAVVGFAALVAMADEMCALEDDEVFGDGGLGDAGASGQGVDSLFAVARESFKDGPAGGVGESFEEVVRFGRHAETIANWLLVCQAFFDKPRRGSQKSNELSRG